MNADENGTMITNANPPGLTELVSSKISEVLQVEYNAANRGSWDLLLSFLKEVIMDIIQERKMDLLHMKTFYPSPNLRYSWMQ